SGPKTKGAFASKTGAARFSLPPVRMHAVVGIFDSIRDARRGAKEVFRSVPSARVRLVSPEASSGEIDTLPTDDAEQPGMGAAVGGGGRRGGGGAGGGVGGGGGGAPLAGRLAPPLGAAAVAEIAGGALLGAGGGAVAGDALEEELSLGVPRDELVVYQDALER